MLLHEDYPHVVPMRAKLRWKENWFWIFMDPDREVFCLAHATVEPTMDRAFASFTLLHKGRKYTSAKEVPVPYPFERQREINLGDLTYRFVKPQAEFQVEFENEELAIKLDFSARFALFDFLACSDVNPDQLSISECTGFGLGQFRHQSQALSGKGFVTFKGDGGQTLELSGSAYRDHSWGMRNDETAYDHNWSVINFPDHAFHFFRLHGALRPNVTLMEGYVATKEGNRVLKSFEIEYVGEDEDGLPTQVKFNAIDYDEERYTIVCNLSDRFARIALHSQKPGQLAYFNSENMCPCTLEQTGDAGFANVEIGWLTGVDGNRV
ncbi:MAG: hypothetical protein EOO82_00120 [Oxalobacteraceae bacterium]|nr:MAG: hypothetical protein EOO82_00120 [Oxalobacteraceae bacterium]